MGRLFELKEPRFCFKFNLEKLVHCDSLKRKRRAGEEPQSETFDNAVNAVAPNRENIWRNFDGKWKSSNGMYVWM